MYEATFELETLTPLFMRSADQRKAEFRSASVKGVMRWWFRALAGSYFGSDIDGLRRAECRVFGCAGKETRRSRVVVEVDIGDYESKNRPLPMVWNKRSRKRISSPAIPEGTKLTIKLKSHDENALELASYSLVAMSYFGGLGFRSNRGAGSVWITNVKIRQHSIMDISLPSKESEYREFPDILVSKVNAILREMGYSKKREIEYPEKSGKCLQYSTMSKECFSVWLWGECSELGGVYYSSNPVCNNGNGEGSNSKRLLDAFEACFKDEECHTSKRGYKDWVFGTPRPRRASPMKVGVVKLDGKYHLRFSVFKTDPFSPKVRVNWDHIDGFLRKIRAKRIYPLRRSDHEQRVFQNPRQCSF
ncbi:type III-B CRISPR module RAMP protein Cmr1 [Thermococcus sp. MAR1]|uniref:type III-B CRISPR module RAMP protein Cmr1 n=1 Tax=Thermococcus sp. MAR1 TaxID=1638263 RepID=UPI00143A9884|nr:type III-B CRISPR module RAMP protein Cmr1 [Thermococcus sp. MAR1]NJE10072.1 type III-B CRISPR module RAMP protein Cmr1 [Thermococcus sp. MAR1]